MKAQVVDLTVCDLEAFMLLATPRGAPLPRFAREEKIIKSAI